MSSTDLPHVTLFLSPPLSLLVGHNGSGDNLHSNYSLHINGTKPTLLSCSLRNLEFMIHLHVAETLLIFCWLISGHSRNLHAKWKSQAGILTLLGRSTMNVNPMLMKSFPSTASLLKATDNSMVTSCHKTQELKLESIEFACFPCALRPTLHNFRTLSRVQFGSCLFTVFILYRMKKDIGPDYIKEVNFGGVPGSAKGFRVSGEQGRAATLICQWMEESPLNPHYSFFGSPSLPPLTLEEGDKFSISSLPSPCMYLMRMPDYFFVAEVCIRSFAI